MTTKTMSTNDPLYLGPATGNGRGQLTSTQLYRLAASGKVVLGQPERNRVSPDYLFVLAITGKVKLSQHDKHRLCSVHLWQLALMQRIELSPSDRGRLASEQLLGLIVHAALPQPKWPPRNPR